MAERIFQIGTISFSSYEKYADFVMATRAYKDKCINRLSEKKERDGEEEYNERE